MGTLVAYSALGSRAIKVASAEDLSGPPPSTVAFRFDIKPGTLSDVLAQFTRISGIKSKLSNDAMGGILSPGVSGTLTIEEALQQLVKGTGVAFRFTTPTVVTLQLRGVTQSVAVTSRAPAMDPYADPDALYKADRLSSTKFSEPVLNTARTETILTQQALEDKNATNLREVLRSTAGVTLGSGEGGNAFGDRFFIRGFDARNDVFIDGVRDPGVSIRENFDVEQIEILRGPASSFAGRGTTGGALNIVTKEVQRSDFISAEVEGGLGDATRRGTVDINKSVSPSLDVRLNAMVQYADVAGRDDTTDNRWGIAGNVVYHPTEKFKATANYSHSYLWGIPDFGVPYDQVTKAPVTEGIVPRSTYYGATNRDFTKSTQDVGTGDLTYQVNEHLTLENKIRASHSLLNYIGTIAENPSANGVTKPYSSTPTFFSGYVQLNAQSRYEPVDVLTDQPQANIAFNTGQIHHAAVVGGEFSREKISIQGYSGLTSELTIGPVLFSSNGAPIVSVYNPPHVILGSGIIQLAGNPLVYHVDTKAAYVMDTASFRDFIFINAGIRYDGYHITAANNVSSRSANNGINSYNIGLTVKPTKNGSLYAAYATAADPVGDELDATSSSYGGLSATQNATQIFGPQKSRSYEVGAKWELLGRHLLLSAAPFETVVTNARESAPNGLPGYTSGQIVAGAAYRVRGLDFEAAGRLTSRWSLMGGYVVMSPRVTHSIVPTNIGLQLANIAPRSLNLLSKYQLLRWLELGGQVIYASQIKGGSLLAANGGVAYPNTPNPTLLPAHCRLDVFAEARINEHTSLRLYGQNLTDKTYYDAFYQSAQPFIQVAPGRAVHMSVVVRF